MNRSLFRLFATQRLFATATATCLGLTACAVSDDGDEDLIEAEVKITPPGSDHPGQLVVQLPDELRSAPPGSASSFSVRVGTQWLTFGTPLTLPIGTAWLEGFGSGIEIWASATIASDQTTTVQLGGFRFTAPTELVPGINGFPHVINTNQGLGVAGVGTDYLTKASPRFAGTYRFTWGLHDGVDVPLAANQMKVVNLGDFSGRRAIRIVAAPVRELPECTSAPYQLSANNTSSRQAALLPGQTVLVGEAAWKRDPSINYFLSTPGTNHGRQFSISMPAQVGQVTEYRLGRLDIDDVAVDTPAGVRPVRGSYGIFPLTIVNGQEVVGGQISNCSTHTGVDVLPGRYRIHVTYWTVESGSKSTIIDVDVPPGG